MLRSRVKVVAAVDKEAGVATERESAISAERCRS